MSTRKDDWEDEVDPRIKVFKFYIQLMKIDQFKPGLKQTYLVKPETLQYACCEITN